MIRHQLARINRLLGDFQNSFGSQRTEVGLVDGKQNLGARGLRYLVLRLRMQLRGANQIAGAAEVGDKLTEQQPCADAVVNCGIR